MKAKKNPKKDLNKKINLYFVVGLTLVLIMVFVALEWKTYDTVYDFDISLNDIDESIDEEVPLFELKATPPPTPPVTTSEIEIAED
jgi:protein TonB